MDYDSTPINATFTVGTTRAMVNIPVIVDNIVEEPEMFDLSFTIPSSVIPGAIATATGTITDDTSKKILLESINLLSSK